RLGRPAQRTPPPGLGASAAHLGGGHPGRPALPPLEPEALPVSVPLLRRRGRLPSALRGRGREPPALPDVRRFRTGGLQRRPRGWRLRRVLPPRDRAGAPPEPAPGGAARPCGLQVL